MCVCACASARVLKFVLALNWIEFAYVHDH